MRVDGVRGEGKVGIICGFKDWELVKGISDYFISVDMMKMY